MGSVSLVHILQKFEEFWVFGFLGVFPSGNCGDVKYMFGLFPFNLHKANPEGGQRNKVGGVTAGSVGWSSLPEISWPKTEGLVFIPELFTHSNTIPLSCHVYWPLLVIFFCLVYLKQHTTYSIFRGNLHCGPICFSTRREKRSKSTVQSLQVSTWHLTP